MCVMCWRLGGGVAAVVCGGWRALRMSMCRVISARCMYCVGCLQMPGTSAPDAHPNTPPPDPPPPRAPSLTHAPAGALVPPAARR
jgi:hypothetical protein